MLDLVWCDGGCESGSEGGHDGAASPSWFGADQGSCSYTECECFRLLRARGGGACGGCCRQCLPQRSPLPAPARFSRTYPIGSPSLHSASCASGQRRRWPDLPGRSPLPPSLCSSPVTRTLPYVVFEAGRVIRIDEEQQETTTIAGLAAYRDNHTVY